MQKSAQRETLTCYFSIKPTDPLVSKFILARISTCFG